MLSTNEIVLKYICPALGVILANVMFAAPLIDLRKAVENGKLGDLNPTPWAFMLGNCFGWTAYAILVQDLWIFFADCPGFIISVWLNLGAVKLLYKGHYDAGVRDSVINLLPENDQNMSVRYPVLHTSTGADVTNNESDEESGEITNESLSEDGSQSRSSDENKTGISADWTRIITEVFSKQASPTRAPHEQLVMFFVFIWVSCISLICFMPAFSQSTKKMIVGLLGNLNLIFFFGAPLSTIKKVLKDRDSSSIHVPTMVTNTMSSSFWAAYGLAISDFYVAAPQIVGAGFGAIQIILCVGFPKRLSEEDVQQLVEFPIVSKKSEADKSSNM